MPSSEARHGDRARLGAADPPPRAAGRVDLPRDRRREARRSILGRWDRDVLRAAAGTHLRSMVGSSHRASAVPHAARSAWGTLVVELAFLPLAMIPSRVTRLLAVVTAAGLHLGILTLMNVGNFPVIMLSALRPIPSSGMGPPLHGRPRSRLLCPRGQHPRVRRSVAPAALLARRRDRFFRDGGTKTARVTATKRRRGDAASLSFPRSALGHVLAGPRRSDWWLIAPATLADDTRFDL